MARRRGVLSTLVQIQREAEREHERRIRAAQRAQRDAERSAAARSRAQAQDQRTRDRMYAEDRAREASDQTEQVNREVEALENVLSATIAVDDYLDLEALKSAPQLPVFDPAVLGRPPSQPPRLEEFVPAATSGIGRVFGGAKHAAKTEQGQHAYEQALGAHQLDMQRHAERLEASRQQHAAATASTLAEHRRQVEDITELQRGLAAGEPDAVIGYLDLVLEAARYPEGFPHRWRLTFVPGSGQLAIEYELPPLEVVPIAKAHKYVSGAIKPTARPVGQVRALYVKVVNQTALRVVHEVLEADRGAKVRTIVFNGHVSGTDPATGRTVRPCLVAYATSRERFLQLDLSRVEPAACLAHLEARLSRDPSKLVAVDPIVLSGTLDSGYAIDTHDEPAQPATNQGSDGGRPAAPAPSSANRQDLLAGQNVPLMSTRMHIVLPTPGVALSILLLGSSGRVDRDEDFIFYNNPRSGDGAVELTGGDSPDGAILDLSRLAEHYERLVLVASADDGVRSVAGSSLLVRQPDGGSELSFRPTDQTNVSAMVSGEVYRRNGGWRLRALGQGWVDGLAGLAREFGVDVG